MHFWQQRHSTKGWENLKPRPAGAKLRLRGQALVGHGLAPVLELRATREALGRRAGQAGQALLGGSFDKADSALQACSGCGESPRELLQLRAQLSGCQ